MKRWISFSSESDGQWCWWKFLSFLLRISGHLSKLSSQLQRPHHWCAWPFHQRSFSTFHWSFCATADHLNHLWYASKTFTELRVWNRVIHKHSALSNLSPINCSLVFSCHHPACLFHCSGKAPPNLAQGVPPLLANQYIMGPGGLLPAYPVRLHLVFVLESDLSYIIFLSGYLKLLTCRRFSFWPICMDLFSEADLWLWRPTDHAVASAHGEYFIFRPWSPPPYLIPLFAFSGSRPGCPYLNTRNRFEWKVSPVPNKSVSVITVDWIKIHTLSYLCLGVVYVRHGVYYFSVCIYCIVGLQQCFSNLILEYHCWICYSWSKTSSSPQEGLLN